MSQDKQLKLYEPPQEYHKRFYRKYFQGALVRSGASLIMWLFALLAFAINTIGRQHFIGVSLAVLYLILINPPTLWILKRIEHQHRLANFSTCINLLEILGYTAVIYSLGGYEATYLTPIYAALITYVGAMTDRWRTFLIAGTCTTAYAAMILLESSGVIPWLKVNPTFTATWPVRLIHLSVVVALLFVTAYIASLHGLPAEKNPG